MLPRNAREEAQEAVGAGYDARVLEPSPPAVTEEPWFADDPVARGRGGGRPVVSPVGTGDVTWDEWLVVHPDHREWAARRWLGARTRLERPPAALAATRLSLHRVAAYVVSPARRRANSKIALRWTLDGLGTPFFGADEQVRIAGRDLIVQQGAEARATPLTTLDDAAAFVLDDAPDVPWASQFDVPDPGDSGGLLEIDVDAAGWLADWYGFGTAALETVRADDASTDASRPQLWPEHFDVAFECLSEQNRRRAGFGASPGDADHPEPYLYVTLWFPDDVAPSPLWNAEHFGGAILELSQLLAADDQIAEATGFFRSRRDALAAAD